MKSLFVLLYVLLVAVGFLAAEKFECKLGAPYIENECNRCSCTEDNKLTCTRKACPWNTEKGLQNCIVGRIWDAPCDNTCYCLEDVGTLCTAYKCHRGATKPTEKTQTDA